MKSESPVTWHLTVGVMIVLSLLASLALIAAGGWDWFKATLDNAAPAWIQAIGSVAAIVAAAAIARQQSQSASELETKKQASIEKQKFMLIMALMARAHGLSNDICKAFRTHNHEDFSQVTPSLMMDTHHALQALPIFEIPNGLLALDILTVGRALASLHEGWLTLREATAGSKELAQSIEKLDVLAQEVHEISLEALTECKKEIAKRSSGESLDG